MILKNERSRALIKKKQKIKNSTAGIKIKEKRKKAVVKTPKKVVNRVKAPVKKKTARTTSRRSENVISAKNLSMPVKEEFIDTYELPVSYDVTNITLIARDPYWLYAYWEISGHSIEKIRKKIGSKLENAIIVVRIYDVTFKDFDGTNANHWFDIDVGPDSNNWYINVCCDNATYCADIGLRAQDGTFFTLERSSVVTTQRAGLSGRFDMIWMDVKENQNQQQPFIIANRRNFEETGFGQKQTFFSEAENDSRFGKASGKYKIPLTLEVIRAYYFRLLPLLRLIKSFKNYAGYSLHEIWLEDNYGIYSKEGLLLDNVSLRMKDSKEIFFGASENRVFGPKNAGASERNQESIDRKFYFEIGTELIVYGRTEPDANVYLGGKNIKLRNDGTFTLRFALPEGNIPLDFTAVSNDKIQKRSIATAVKRSKTI